MSDQTTVSRPKRQQTAELPQADDSNRPGVGLPGVLLLGLLPFGLALACSESSPQQADNVETTPATALVLKTTVGLDFEHDNGATGAYNYPEMMQGGAGFLDFDGDGLLDIYMVQSGELPPSASQTKTNRLFRNLGHRDFRDVTSAARVGDNGYGSGLATGDFDGDGLADLFITNLGSNRLYRNLGQRQLRRCHRKAQRGSTWLLDLRRVLRHGRRWRPRLVRVQLRGVVCGSGDSMPGLQRTAGLLAARRSTSLHPTSSTATTRGVSPQLRRSPASVPLRARLLALPRSTSTATATSTSTRQTIRWRTTCGSRRPGQVC